VKYPTEGEHITGTPSGKQRQKKSGRGRPTPSLIASVKTAVIAIENRRPARAN
jgi:hypothetical protein